MESPKPEHAPAPTTPAASKRVALITGASSGLGREFARQLDNLQMPNRPRQTGHPRRRSRNGTGRYRGPFG